MGGEWQESFLDIRLDSTVDLSSEPMMVPLERLLRARNVVHDKPGTARMRPARNEGATVGLFSRIWDLAVAKVYTVAARAGDGFVVSQDGLLRHRFDGAAWVMSRIQREFFGGVIQPSQMAPMGLTGSAFSTSENSEHFEVHNLVHYGYEWFLSRPEGGGLYLKLRTLDGEDVETYIVETGAVSAAELMPTNLADSTGYVRVFWLSGGTVHTRVFEPGNGEIVRHNQQSLADTVNTAVNFNLAAASENTGFGFEVIYVPTGATSWAVIGYSAANEDSVSKVHLHDTARTPNTLVDQPDIIVNRSGRTEAIYTADTNDVYVIVMDAITHGSAMETNRFPGVSATRCMISRAGDASTFIAAADTAASTQQIHAGIVNDVGLKYSLRVGGCTPIARPGEVDGLPLLPVIHSRDNTQWSRGISLLTVSPNTLRMVATGRCGIDSGRGFVSSAHIGKIQQTRQGQPRSFAYTTEEFGWPQNARGVRLDNNVRSGFVEANGLTYMPGCEPSVYDGESHRPATWLEFPLILDVFDGNNGSLDDEIGNTDPHSFRGVWVWIDTQGRAHRSPPGPAFEWTPALASDVPAIEVMYPKSAAQYGGASDATDRDPFNLFLEVYVQRIGTDAVHKLAWTLAASETSVWVPDSITSDHVATYDVVSYNPAGAALYTDAGELESSPLPAVAQFELIGDRMWALEAEDRTRLWPSKTLQDGYAYEWSAALVQRVPGEPIEAISQIANGRALVLRKDGLFVFYGDGPTNGGVGGDFGVPRRVDGAPGCFDGAVVVKVPQGVMYQSDSGFHILRPDLSVTDVSPSLDLYVQEQSFVTATYSDKDKRAVFWTDGGEHLVYDTRQGKWSTWESDAARGAAQLRSGAVLMTRPNLITADGPTDFELSTYETGVDAAENGVEMVWRTAWLQPVGIHGRCKWGRVILTMRKHSTHTLTVRAYTRGDDSSAVGTRTWSDAELNEELQGEIYQVETTGLFPTALDANANAVMIEVEVSRVADVGAAASPLAMRVTFSTDGDRRRQQLGSGGRK